METLRVNSIVLDENSDGKALNYKRVGVEQMKETEKKIFETFIRAIKY